MSPEANHTAHTLARLAASRRTLRLKPSCSPEELESFACKWNDYSDSMANLAEELCVQLGLLPRQGDAART